MIDEAVFERPTQPPLSKFNAAAPKKEAPRTIPGMRLFMTPNTEDVTAGAILGENLLALPLRDAREIFERTYMRELVIFYRGRVGKMASHVEMERTHLYRKLAALGLREKGCAPDLPDLGTPEFGPAVQAEMDARGITLVELVEAARKAKEAQEDREWSADEEKPTDQAPETGAES